MCETPVAWVGFPSFHLLSCKWAQPNDTEGGYKRNTVCVTSFELSYPRTIHRMTQIMKISAHCSVVRYPRSRSVTVGLWGGLSSCPAHKSLLSVSSHYHKRRESLALLTQPTRIHGKAIWGPRRVIHKTWQIKVKDKVYWSALVIVPCSFSWKSLSPSD